MKTLRNVLFYATLIYSTIFLGIAAMLIAFVTQRSDWSHLCARLWGRLNLLAAGVRVTVEGLEHIERDRPAIYAANHQSWFDIFALLAELPVQFRWLAKEELFKIPFLGSAMAASGYIPINRSDRRKAMESLNHAAEQIRKGTSVVIFPEGTRSPDGVLQEFKKGGFILAIKARCPIVPISISGSHRVLPKNERWRIRPGTIRIFVCPPVPTEGTPASGRDRLMDAVREAIRSHLPQSEGGVLPGGDQPILSI